MGLWVTGARLSGALPNLRAGCVVVLGLCLRLQTGLADGGLIREPGEESQGETAWAARGPGRRDGHSLRTVISVYTGD